MFCCQRLPSFNGNFYWISDNNQSKIGDNFQSSENYALNQNSEFRFCSLILNWLLLCLPFPCIFHHIKLNNIRFIHLIRQVEHWKKTASHGDTSSIVVIIVANSEKTISIHKRKVSVCFVQLFLVEQFFLVVHSFASVSGQPFRSQNVI